MRTADKIGLGLVGAAAVTLVAAACLPRNASSRESAKPSDKTVATWSVSQPPVTDAVSSSPGNSTSQAATASSAPHTTPQASTVQNVPTPANTGSFRLVVKTNAGRQILATSVDWYHAVQGPDGQYEPIDPPVHNRAAWVEQSAYPATPSQGTSYIYGHACHHNTCSFTRLKNAQLGDLVIVTTPAGVLTYKVTHIGTSLKSTNALPVWASNSTVSNRLVLVTCAYESGDISLTNLVVAATLVAAASR